MLNNWLHYTQFGCIIFIRSKLIYTVTVEISFTIEINEGSDALVEAYLQQPSVYLRDAKKALKKIEGLALLYAQSKILQTPVAEGIATQINNSSIPKMINTLFSPSFLGIVFTGYLATNTLAIADNYKQQVSSHKVSTKYTKRIDEISDYFHSICFETEKKREIDINNYSDEEIMIGLSQFIEKDLAEQINNVDNEEMQKCSAELKEIAETIKTLALISSTSLKNSIVAGKFNMGKASYYYGSLLSYNTTTSKALDQLVNKQLKDFINLRDPVNSALNVATVVGTGYLVNNLAHMSTTANPFTAVFAPVIAKIIPLTIAFAVVYFLDFLVKLVFGRMLLKTYTAMFTGTSYTPSKNEIQQFADIYKTYQDITTNLNDIKEKVELPELKKVLEKAQKEIEKQLVNSAVVIHMNKAIKQAQEKMDKNPQFRKNVEQALSFLNKKLSTLPNRNVQSVVAMCSKEIQKAKKPDRQAVAVASQILITQMVNKEIGSEGQKLLMAMLQQDNMPVKTSKAFTDLCKQELSVLNNLNNIKIKSDITL